jgi:hypothetical protein
MKKNLMIGAIALVAGSLLAAESDTKDAVNNAAKKLAEQSNYSWKTTSDTAGGGGGGGGGGGAFRPGPTEGKTEKDGYTMLKMTRGDNTIQAVLKGGKGAIKTAEEWQSLSEAAEAQGGGGGGRGRGGFMARMLQNYKTPAAEAQDLISKVKDLKEADGVYSGALTEEGAKSLLRFGGGRGGAGGGGGGPEISGAKGSVKLWVNDGLLTKYQVKVQGTMSFNGNDRDIDRTTTVEIKDIGSSKVEIPSEAAKKAS